MPYYTKQPVFDQLIKLGNQRPCIIVAPQFFAEKTGIKSVTIMQWNTIFSGSENNHFVWRVPFLYLNHCTTLSWNHPNIIKCLVSTFKIKQELSKDILLSCVPNRLWGISLAQESTQQKNNEIQPLKWYVRGITNYWCLSKKIVTCYSFWTRKYYLLWYTYLFIWQWFSQMALSRAHNSCQNTQNVLFRVLFHFFLL